MKEPRTTSYCGDLEGDSCDHSTIRKAYSGRLRCEVGKGACSYQTQDKTKARREQRKVHDKSCVNCASSWYHEHDPGEVINVGEEGWVCDGPHSGKANLKGFPFITEQKCFEPRR